MADVKVAVVKVDLPTSGTVSATVSGFGTPKAAMVLFSRANTTNNPEDIAVVGIGFTDGTRERAFSIRSDDNQANTSSTRDAKTTGVVVEESTIVYGFSQWVTDGVELDITSGTTTVNRQAIVVLFGGADLSAHVNTFTPNSTQNGTQATTDPGFTPDVVFFADIGLTTFASSTQTILAYGCAVNDGSATQRCIFYSEATGQTDGVPEQYLDTTGCMGQLFSGALSWTGELTSFDANGFTVTTRDGGSGGDVVGYLALNLGGASFSLSSLTTPTSTGNADAQASLGFNPQAAIAALSTVSTLNTAFTNSGAEAIFLSAFDGTQEHSVGCAIEDAAATTNTESRYANNALRLVRKSATADLISASFVDFTNRVRLNYTTADATARLGWILSIEQQPSQSVWVPSFRSRFWWYKATAGTTFTASAALTLGGATLAASATFAPGTHTATAALTAGGATAAASATHTTPTYTATAAATAGATTFTASATFSPATSYTATAALTAGAATSAASATFTVPTYTATAAVTAGASQFTASATHTTPTYTATAAVTTGGATGQATASFASSVFLASAALTAGGATGAASATFVAPVYTASSALTSGAAVFAASATHAGPAFTATAAVTAGASSFTASATFTGDTSYTATAALTLSGATFAATAIFAVLGIPQPYRPEMGRDGVANSRRPQVGQAQNRRPNPGHIV